jgi:hypothetical protein
MVSAVLSPPSTDLQDNKMPPSPSHANTDAVSGCGFRIDGDRRMAE